MLSDEKTNSEYISIVPFNPSLALHPDGEIVATGQVKGRDDENDEVG